MFIQDYDFRYNRFSFHATTLIDYIDDAIYFKNNCQNEYDEYSHSLNVVESIVSCIISNDFDFKPNNKEIFKSLYIMLRDCCHENGKYSDNARLALRKICEHCGFPGNAIELRDKKTTGLFGKISKKISSWFGKKNTKDPVEDVIDQMFAAKEQSKSDSQPKTVGVLPVKTVAENTVKKQQEPVKTASVQTPAAKEQSKSDSQPKTVGAVPVKTVAKNTVKKQSHLVKPVQPIKTVRKKRSKFGFHTKTIVATPVKSVAKKIVKEQTLPVKTAPEQLSAYKEQPKSDFQSKPVSNHTYTKIFKFKLPKINYTKPSKRTMFAAAITGGILIGAMLFGGGNKKNNSANINEKSVTELKSVTPMSTAHYKSVTTYNLVDSVKTQQNKYKPATDSVSVKLTAASRSALDILMGEEKAQKLCNDVRAKLDAGIFKLPNGMSIERVAHAMQMSRVYEGHSVILDALNSNTKLTDAQQAAFNEHIANIGDLGVKLQKRMAAKHKLSHNNRYSHAKKSLRAAHAKNLKQLKLAKKQMQQSQR
ncbi:MAG: hypothetical protein IKF41_01940 [Alphaproteobacteria bacterium]|nr:hypothetical protein [Alphaproteobacteria bacterium]